MSWKEIKIPEIQGIEKVVAEFYVGCATYMPNCQFRVKITQDNYGNYSGRINVAIKNSKDGSPEWIGGKGESIDKALEDAIKNFIDSVKCSGMDLNNLTDKDFEWSAPDDF